MAKTSIRSQSTSKKNSRGWRIAVYVSVFLGVAATLGLIVLLFGQVSGVEFSPSRFETRRFTVREIPWLKIQVTPIRRTTSQSATARYLLAQSLIQPLKAPMPTKPAPTKPPSAPNAVADSKAVDDPKTSKNVAAPSANPTTPPDPWHLVQLTRGGVDTQPADAKLLTDQLEAYGFNASQNKEHWHQWSINEPAKAKVFWPIIQRLAVRELYVLMPPLFALAIDSMDDVTLKTSIDEYLKKNYADLVVELRSAGREAFAEELLNEALIDFPDDQRLQALR